MSIRLEIREELRQLGGAEYQSLCSDVFAREYPHAAWGEPGAMVGQNKTTTGAPDVYLIDQDGKAMFLEATTSKIKVILKKVKGDIDHACDQAKTGIARQDVKLIVVAYNKDVEAKIARQIQEYGNQKRVKLEQWSLVRLADMLEYKHPGLLLRHLGIKRDTGQFSTVEEFFGNKNLNSTASLDLRVKYVKSENKVDDVSLALLNGNVVLIHGLAGTGKTRLAYEFLREEEGSSRCDVICVKNKGLSFEDSLMKLLDVEKQTIILIDDAAKHLALVKQMVAFVNGHDQQLVKLVLTARTSELEPLQNILPRGLPKIPLERLSDDDIKAIVESAPLNIRNTRYSTRIIEMSNGNPRFAIMAANVAKRRNTDFLDLGNRELYDEYYQDSIHSKLTESQRKVSVVMAAIRSIDLSRHEIVDNILSLILLSRDELYDTLEQLHDFELLDKLDTMYRTNNDTICEWWMWDNCINGLSVEFSRALEILGGLPGSKFTGTIVQVTNDIGFKEVEPKLIPELIKYEQVISANSIVDYCSDYWAFRPVRCLGMLQNEINPESISKVEMPNEKLAVSKNDYYSLDKRLRVLLQYIKSGVQLEKALELARYCCLSELEQTPHFMSQLADSLSINSSDQRFGFGRQVKFIETISTGVEEGDVFFVHCLIALLPKIFAHKSSSSHGGRGNKIFIENVEQINSEGLLGVRAQARQLVSRVNSPLELEALFSIVNVQRGSYEKNKELWLQDAIDLFYLISGVSELSSFDRRLLLVDAFYCIPSFIEELPEYKDFVEFYASPPIDLAIDLKRSLHSFQDKDLGYVPHNEVVTLKRNFLAREWVVSRELTAEVFRRFLNFSVLYPRDFFQGDVKYGVDLLLSEAINNEHPDWLEMVIDFFQAGIGHNPYCTLFSMSRLPDDVFLSICNDPAFVEEKLRHVPSSILYMRPSELVTQTVVDLYLEKVQKVESISVLLKVLEKFYEVDIDFYFKFIDTVDMMSNNGKSIELDCGFLSLSSKIDENRFSIIGEVFWKSIKSLNYSANNYESVKSYLTLFPSKLSEYFELLVNSQFDPHQTKLEFVWDMLDAEEIIDSLFEHYWTDMAHRGELRQPFCHFFPGHDSQHDRTSRFILERLVSTAAVYEKFLIVYEAAKRHPLVHQEQIIASAVEGNMRVSDFESVFSQHGVLSGRSGTNFSSLRLDKWGRLLTILQSLPDQVKAFDYIAEVESNIDYYRQAETRDSRDIFMNNLA